MSFAFNFSTDDDNHHSEPRKDVGVSRSEGVDSKALRKPPLPSSFSSSWWSSSSSSSSSSSFSWLPYDEVRSILLQPIVHQTERINLSQASCVSCPEEQHMDDSVGSISNVTTSLRHVKEGSAPSTFPATDLVPGEYEGGMKVWECSVDLCRYLQENPTILPKRGRVLELGCGHGLPGVLVLCSALRQKLYHHHHHPQQQDGVSRHEDRLRQQLPSIDINVSWIDFNKFCIDRVTIPNVLVNIQDCVQRSHACRQDLEGVVSWITNHTQFGAGHWNVMSRQLLLVDDQIQSASQSRPTTKSTNDLGLEQPACGGSQFELILAAETTYTEQSAKDTARIVASHLVPGSGVAIIATKRFYFGVGGGTNAFEDGLAEFESQRHRQQQQDDHLLRPPKVRYTLHVEKAAVFDDGRSNIRELIVVKSVAL